MRLARSLFLNRIGGQMAILILASLLAIHAVIIAGLFLSHRFERARAPTRRPASSPRWCGS